jgi:hypothetical protein
LGKKNKKSSEILESKNPQEEIIETEVISKK